MKVYLFIMLGGGVVYLQGWPFLCHRRKCTLFYTDKINLLSLQTFGKLPKQCQNIAVPTF